MSGPKTPVSSPPKLGRLSKALAEPHSSGMIKDTEMTDVSVNKIPKSRATAVPSERVLRSSPKKKVGFETASDNGVDSSPTRSIKTTPEKRDSIGSIPVTVPFTPTLKRTSSGHYKLPEYMHKLALPQQGSKNVLKTPRPYDSDEEDEENESKQIFRPQKTFLSPVGKRLVFDNSGNPVVPSGKDISDMSEISHVLKLKLTSALGKLQQQNLERQLQRQMQFNQLLDTMSSPTKKVKKRPVSMPNPLPSTSSQFTTLGPTTSSQPPISPLPGLPTPGNRQLGNGANLNLKTLQQSPVSYSQHHRHSHHFHPIHNMPSPDEEQSAHNALMIALAKVGGGGSGAGDRESPRKSTTVSNQATIDTRVISATVNSPTANRRHSMNLRRSSLLTSLPPIETCPSALSKSVEEKPSTTEPPSTTNGEQEAIMSLMLLCSPRNLHGGLITTATPDNDETDVEDATEDESDDNEMESNAKT